MSARLRVGCPVWATSAWRGGLYPRATAPADYLEHYARVFTTVEGSSSFYALPSAAAVARWRSQTPPDFRFCFKFPSEITHQLMLRNARLPTHAFLQRMAPLADRLGPLMIQLGPRFGPAQLPALTSFLEGLSPEFRYAVEVRHPQFFAIAEFAEALDGVLAAFACDRVLFDSRCMHAATNGDQATREAQARKPLLPVPMTVTSQRPIVRFIAQNEVAAADAYLDAWAEQLVQWLQAGLKPYFFAHTPDDRAAPELARELHRRVRARWPALSEFPVFPGEQEAPLPDPRAQMRLF